MSVIVSLTHTQERARRALRERWRAWGLCTDRADRPRAESAIIALRRRLGIETDTVFEWVGSPLGIVEASVGDVSRWQEVEDAKNRLFLSLGLRIGAEVDSSEVGPAVGDAWESIGASVWDSVSASVWRAVWERSWDERGPSLLKLFQWGQHDAHSIAFYLLGRDVLGLSYDSNDSAELDLWVDIARSCGWWSCCNDRVVISERPTACRLDGRGLIHAERGPAVAFSDGLEVHAWHGVVVPPAWIERGPTVCEAVEEEDVDRRYAACDILGWDRIVSDLGARIVDVDDDPEVGELLELVLPYGDVARFLRARCATGQTFALPVPGIVTTAAEANAISYGISVEMLRSREYRT